MFPLIITLALRVTRPTKSRREQMLKDYLSLHKTVFECHCYMMQCCVFLNLGGREHTCCKVSQNRTVSYYVGSLAERGMGRAWGLSVILQCKL